MKKVLILMALLAMVASPSMATYDFADDADGLTLGSAAPLVVRGSKSVKIDYITNSADPYDGYIIGAYHTKGSKSFATSSHDTKIYRSDATAQDLSSLTVPTGSEGSVTWATGTWTPL